MNMKALSTNDTIYIRCNMQIILQQYNTQRLEVNACETDLLYETDDSAKQNLYRDPPYHHHCANPTNMTI